MAAKKIDGKAFAENLRAKIAQEVAELKSTHNIVPGLAVLLVGADAASEVYVRNKKKATIEAGMNSFDFHLPANISRAELLEKIAQLNADDAVDGILVQLPLPNREDEEAVIQAIAPAKDVDGFHVINAGKLFLGQKGLVPCTPLGCLMLLQANLGDLSGKHAVILGRSNIVGKPMAALLLAQNCTVTIAHSQTKNLKEECLRADILIAAVGRAEMVRGDWIKEGATIIDVGINRTETGLVGDVCYAEAAEKAAAITPVPGGVGPMTIACLLHNTLTAARLRRGIAEKNCS